MLFINLLYTYTWFLFPNHITIIIIIWTLNVKRWTIKELLSFTGKLRYLCNLFSFCVEQMFLFFFVSSNISTLNRRGRSSLPTYFIPSQTKKKNYKGNKIEYFSLTHCSWLLFGPFFAITELHPVSNSVSSSYNSVSYWFFVL